MRHFQFYVTDDRYSVRSLMLVETHDTPAARALAQRLLAQDPHYHRIDAWADELLLFSVREAATPLADPS
jgi:hypothetical protein